MYVAFIESNQLIMVDVSILLLEMHSISRFSNKHN